MAIRSLLLLPLLIVLTQAISPKEFLGLLKKGPDAYGEVYHVVLDALYENHPSFFANEDEFAQVKAELRMAEQFSRANETSKLNSAYLPTVSRKLEELDAYIKSVMTEEIVQFQASLENISWTDVAAKYDFSYRSAIEFVLDLYNMALAKFMKLPVATQNHLIDIFPVIPTIGRATLFLRDVLYEDDKTRATIDAA